MKSPLYVASVARAYRRAIDDCMEDPERYAERIPWYVGQVTAGESRPFSTGFFYGKPDAGGQIYGESSRPAAYTYLGLVQHLDADGRPVILQKNKFAVGDAVEIMQPDGTDEEVLVRAIFDAEGCALRDAPHPLQELHLLLEKDGSPVSPQPGLILRKHINGDVAC